MTLIERITLILSYLAHSRAECRMIDISKEVGLSKATVYRILSSLEHERWVVRKPNGKYSLGNKIIELSIPMLTDFSLIRDCTPYLERLRDETGETAILHLLDNLKRLVIQQVQGNKGLLYLAKPGQRLPLWCTAPSKAILAFMEEDGVEAVIAELRRSGVHNFGTTKTPNIDKLREELVDIRRRGFSISVGERVQGAFGLAAPIFDRDSKVIGSISIAGPEARLTDDKVTEYGALLKHIARDISLSLGSPVADVATAK